MPLLLLLVLPGARTPAGTAEGAARALPDLDVGVPPGEPTSWARWIPVHTPRREPLFPATGPRGPGAGAGAAADPRRTVAAVPTVRLDPQIGAAGVLRITTLDVTGHLAWTGEPPPAGPVTGRAALLPPASPSLHWIGTAAFLRVLLHRQQLSAAEVVAHLVELGEPVLGSVAAAAAERALEPVCRRVTELVQRRGRGRAAPAGATPRERMLLRFCTEELARAHPYDPEGDFGDRLFLFAEEVEPLLRRLLASDAEPFVVRNAAAALGRYRTASAQRALVQAAAATEDPVVLVRALAALEAPCDGAPLLDRLERARDPVEVAAIVQALGRTGASGAAERLAVLARAGLRGDPDLLMSVLVAACRIAPTGDLRDLRSVAEAVERAARSRPERFEVDAPGGPQPDVPDGSGLRGEILAQLALLVRLRIDGGDGAADLAARVVALVREPDRGPRPGASHPNRALGAAWPPVQMPLIETLRRLGEEGAVLLAAIVADPGCDPVLRVAALGQLPQAERVRQADRILFAPGEPAELRLAAVQVLDHDDGARLAARGRELLRPLLAAPARMAQAPQRAEWLAVVQALDRHGALRADDLVALLPGVRAAATRQPGGAVGLRRQVEELARRLVADVASGLRGRELDRRILELLDLVIAAAMDDRFTAETRASSARYVEGLLAGVPERRRDEAYLALVVRSITDYLALSPEASLMLVARRSELQAEVPLEPAILLALGRTRAAAAVRALAALLADAPDLPWRAHVCLAAGATGDRSLMLPLVRALLDEDGFVRLCASEALRHLSGEDHWADWLYGGLEERGAAAQEWFRCCSRLSR